MMDSTGPWALHVFVAPAIFLPLIALCAYGLVRAMRYLRSDAPRGYSDYVFEAKAGAWICSILALILVGALLGTLFPFSAEYHQWRKVHGEVEQVSKRLIGTDSGMAERYVVVVGGRPYGVDDTRASLVKEGDEITLRCIREWQYQAESGYGCRWAGVAR